MRFVNLVGILNFIARKTQPDIPSIGYPSCHGHFDSKMTFSLKSSASQRRCATSQVSPSAGSAPCSMTRIHLEDDDSGAAFGFVLHGGEGLVGLRERKCRDRGTETDIARQGEKVARILAGHVGHAAKLAFAPEELVVIEGRNLIEVNGVDGDYASFAQGSQSADHDTSHGRKGDGTVERHGRHGVEVADPGGSGIAGSLLARLVAGDNVDFAIPGAKDLQGDGGGAAVSEEADALTALNASHTQAAEPDDAGTEQRRHVDGVEAFGNRVGEIGADGGVLGVAAIDGVAGEDGMIAEVLHLVGAIPAVAVDAADPGDAGACAEGEFRRSAFDDFADDLVTGDDARADGGKIAFNDVEIGTADAAGDHLEKDLAGTGARSGNVLNADPVAGGGRAGMEDGGAHRRCSEI